MITLKHIARDFNLDPYTLRIHLRKEGLTPQVNGRWKWPAKDDPQYSQARIVAHRLASKISGRSSSS